jgi:hypothetical protein
VLVEYVVSKEVVSLVAFVCLVVLLSVVPVAVVDMVVMMVMYPWWCLDAMVVVVDDMGSMDENLVDALEMVEKVEDLVVEVLPLVVVLVAGWMSCCDPCCDRRCPYLIRRTKSKVRGSMVLQ